MVLTWMVTLCSATLGQSSSSTLNQASANHSENVPHTDTHHIYLLLLNRQSGKPVKGVRGFLEGVGQNGKINWPQSVRTDSHGIAEFSLVDPLPERVRVSFEINEFSSCSETSVMTNQILKIGAVAEISCAAGKVYASHPPLAGQLVVYGRGVTVWQRIGQALPYLTLFK